MALIDHKFEGKGGTTMACFNAERLKNISQKLGISARV
jgi:hypothetical protein